MLTELGSLLTGIERHVRQEAACFPPGHLRTFLETFGTPGGAAGPETLLHYFSLYIMRCQVPGPSGSYLQGKGLTGDNG